MHYLLRHTHLLRRPLTALCSVPRAVAVPLPHHRSFTHTFPANSAAGYGDADQTGDDPSNKPNLQGPRPRIDTEHPRRELVGENKGIGSRGGGKVGTVTEREGKGQGGSGRTTKSSLEEWPVVDVKGPLPEAVEKHNREMDQRYDHKQHWEDEKVEKGYWSGESSLEN